MATAASPQPQDHRVAFSKVRSQNDANASDDSVNSKNMISSSNYTTPSSEEMPPDNLHDVAPRPVSVGLSAPGSTLPDLQPIVAVSHRYQRSWKSRLAASMRQARDFLSRPRAVIGRNRTYSYSRRHTAVGIDHEESSAVEEKLDINSATKADLLRLPGVDGSLATAIIDHRKLLVDNRFKRLEDLVNVPGLDVARLNRFRNLICILRGVKNSVSVDSVDSSRPNRNVVGSSGSPTIGSTGSDNASHKISQNVYVSSFSPTSIRPRLSADSCFVHAAGTPLTPLGQPTLLNINKATEQDLVTIAGIRQEIAKKIVMARQNTGPFHAVADLRKVKGVSKRLFAKVRDRLTVDDTQSFKTKLAPPAVALSSSSSTANCKQLETDSGVATNSVTASNGGALSNGAMAGSGASGNTSKQVSPDSAAREMDINNLPDVIIKYTKPSDLELIHKLQVNTLSGSRGRGRGLSARGHNRNVSDFGVAADYADIFSPIYPSDMHGIRPIVEPFDFRSATGAHEPVVRFAFWDIEECGMDKISNPGVLETICMTILENGVSIVAFADLLDVGVVDRIADQLTWPSLHCVREWRGPRGSWRSAVVKIGYRSGNGTSPEHELHRARSFSGDSRSGDNDDAQPVYCGFVYDSSRSIEMVARWHFPSPLQQPSRKNEQESVKLAHPECLNVALPKTALHKLSYRPAAAKFCLSTPSTDKNSNENAYLAIVCLKLSPEDSLFFKRRDIALSTAPLLSAVLDAVNSFGDVPSANKQSASSPPLSVVLAGSFGVDATERCFDLLRVAGYQLACDEKTDISRKKPSGTVCGEHLWISDVSALSSAQRLFTSRAKVVRNSLSHPQIPDGWAWGGLVSSHCPVWAEFYSSPQPDETFNGIHERQ